MPGVPDGSSRLTASTAQGNVGFVSILSGCRCTIGPMSTTLLHRLDSPLVYTRPLGRGQDALVVLVTGYARSTDSARRAISRHAWLAYGVGDVRSWDAMDVGSQRYWAREHVDAPRGRVEVREVGDEVEVRVPGRRPRRVARGRVHVATKEEVGASRRR